MSQKLKTSKLEYTIVCVGGALSAIFLVKKLVDEAKGHLFKILIIEKSDHCQGLAYHLSQSPHLTNNNQAQTSSIDALDENHFINWAARVGVNYSPNSYPHRYIFGLYLEDSLKEIMDLAAKQGIQITYLRGEEVFDFERTHDGNYLVYSQSLDGHTQNIYQANTIILGTGNNRKTQPDFALSLPDERLVENTLTGVNQTKISNFEASQNLAIIGSAYSAMDAMAIRYFNKIKPVLDLAKKDGFSPYAKLGKMYMISRRGLINYLPFEEPNIPVKYPLSPQVDPANITQFLDSNKLITLLNHEFQLGEELGYTKHQIAVALDDVLISLFEKLSSDRESQKFIQDYWNILRAYQNELPEPTARIFRLLEQEGLVEVLSGNIKEIYLDQENIVIEFNEDRAPLRVDAVVNTVGLDHSYQGLLRQSNLLTNLEKRGYISPHRKTNLGLAVNARYEVIGRNGFPSPKVHPLGRLVEGEAISRKFGPYFTGNTGIRGIRTMCAELAPIILRNIENWQSNRMTLKNLTFESFSVSA